MNDKTNDPNNPFGWAVPEPSGAAGDPTPEEVQALEAATEAAELKALETARMVHQVMREGRGPEFMEWLRSITVEVQLIDINGVYGVGNHSLPMTAAEWALYRDGQNSFYHLIKALVKMAEDGVSRETEGKTT
jgi:hypothetical protein